jgi:lipopolysaccharide biosynthesis protein
MSDIKAIAYYLPQFHPIPENDRWWGKGFTEWTNVSRGRPFFPGHHQPHLPADLGFYDLRLAEVRAEQAALARQYGLYGFCYYYYWFNGRRLLERPLDEVVRTGEPDFPFCVCWANENWTRRWDGAEHEILMQQVHSPESDRRFIEDVLPILRDPRYIRVQGAPLLLVYRPGILPEPRRTTDIWRAAAQEAGLPGLHLCAVQSFGLDDPRPLGFDAAAEFPPHGFAPTRINQTVSGLSPEFRGWVYEYEEAVRLSLQKPRPSYIRYRGVMTSWDNTARRGADGHIYRGASPGAYESWLRAVIAETETRPQEEQLVFINAWNEWAEGAHLEPDQRDGHAWLEATARALKHRADWRDVLHVVRAQPDASTEVLRGYLADLEFALEAQERALAEFDRQASRGVLPRPSAVALNATAFTAERPGHLEGARLKNGGLMHLDAVDGNTVSGPVELRRQRQATLSGWAFAPGIEIAAPGTSSYLVLRSRLTRRTYYAALERRVPRADVTSHFGNVEARFTSRSGFLATISTEQVHPGKYQLGVVHSDGTCALAAFSAQCMVSE